MSSFNQYNYSFLRTKFVFHMFINRNTWPENSALWQKLAREIKKSDLLKRGAELDIGDGQYEEFMISSVTRPGQTKHNNNNTAK